MRSLLLLLCLIAAPALSAELNHEQATMIYMLAHSTSHYKLPATAPEIHLVSPQKLRDMVCPGRECTVHGLQVQDKIYFDDSLDMADVYNASILYHETVHFLQWVNRGDAKDCAEWMEREVEAYGLQNHVLEKAGARHLKMPPLSCS